MKIAVVALAVGIIGLVIWRLTASDDESGAIDRLRASIDMSALPESARHDMHALIDQSRLRPSRYAEVLSRPAGDA